MVFNPQQFINQTISAPMATSVKPAPEGEWTMVISTKGTIDDWFGEAKWKDKKTHQERTQPTVKIPMEITDQRAKDILGRDTIIVPYDCFLDIDANGNLLVGDDKNVRIGALREALGQNNDPTWTFAKFWGAGPFIGKVYHKTDEGRDEPFAKISRVTRLK